MLKNFFIVVFLVILGLLVLVSWGSGEGKLKVHFFDVGQGDAIYLRTPEHQDILIDGGPSTVILSKLGEALPFWDRELDIVILTHPHADHVTGLIEVLKKYRVKQVFLTGAAHTTYEYLEFLQLLREQPEIKKVKVDHQFKVQLAPKAELEFFYPNFDITDSEQPLGGKKLNNTSIVVKLTYGDHTFLFTGDIEAEVEENLVKAQQNGDLVLTADVLKIPHHGSRTSSTSEFLQAVRPQQAVIQLGRDNDFGYPHREVIERLEQLGIQILRTDEEGDIVWPY